MDGILSNALQDFYQRTLKPEFDAIKAKLAEHDDRFTEMERYIGSINDRLTRVEDQFLRVSSGLTSIEQALGSDMK